MLAVKAEEFNQEFRQNAVVEKGQNVVFVAVTEEEFRGLKKSMARVRLAKRLETLQKQVSESGVEPMSMEEIDAEIKAYRQEKREKKTCPI